MFFFVQKKLCLIACLSISQCRQKNILLCRRDKVLLRKFDKVIVLFILPGHEESQFYSSEGNFSLGIKQNHLHLQGTFNYCIARITGLVLCFCDR